MNEIKEVKTVLKRVALPDEFAATICTRESPKLYVKCPYCHEIHKHGAEAGAVLGNLGWRMSHCNRNSKLYFLHCVGIVPQKCLVKSLKTLSN
jgi:hypothetical protein